MPNRLARGFVWGVLARLLLAFPVIAVAGYLYLPYDNPSVANSIRLSEMPAFDHTLSDIKRWQVSLLVAGADKAQTPVVMAALRHSVADFAHPERDNGGAGAAK